MVVCVVFGVLTLVSRAGQLGGGAEHVWHHVFLSKGVLSFEAHQTTPFTNTAHCTAPNLHRTEPPPPPPPHLTRAYPQAGHARKASDFSRVDPRTIREGFLVKRGEMGCRVRVALG